MTDEAKVKVNHNDLAALFAGAPRKAAGRTSSDRRAAERKKISSTDGRVLRRMGRDRQYNTRVTDEVADLVEELCDRFDLTKAELTERAIKAYAEHLKSGDQ